MTFAIPQNKLKRYSIIDLGKTAFKWDHSEQKLVPKTADEMSKDAEQEYEQFDSDTNANQ